MEKDLQVLNNYSWGYRAGCVLQAANGVGLFTALGKEELGLDELCRRCGTKTDVTGKLLIACAAMGLVEKKGNRYSNTELSRKYLVKTERLYQGDIIAHSATVRRFWDSLEGQILAGPKGGEEQVRLKPDKIPFASPAEHRDFIMGMDNVAQGGRCELFLEAIDLSGRKKLFDVGGGPGRYSIEACRRYPELCAVVFDIPETIAIAREVIAKEGMSERVEVRSGDWEKDDFGSGNDVVLLSNVMHGPESQAGMMLKKVYDSMVEGGLVVVQEFLLNDGKTGPLVAALFNLMVGAYGRGELFSVISEAGFSAVKEVVSDEEMGSSWITAIKE